MAKKLDKKIDLDLDLNHKAPISINNQLVEDLISSADPSQLFGKDGLFQQLKKQLVNKMLEKEMEVHGWVYQAF